MVRAIVIRASDMPLFCKATAPFLVDSRRFPRSHALALSRRMLSKTKALAIRVIQRRLDGLCLNQALEDGKAEHFNSWARRSVANMVRATPIRAIAMP